MKKIAWAIDAFEETGNIQSRCLEAITQLVSNRPGASVIPLYVLSPEHLNLPMEFNTPLQQHYSEIAMKAIQSRLKGANLKNIKEPKILIQPSATIRGSVTKIVNYCKANKIDLMVVGTHGRSGIQRTFLGSFAETLLNFSKVPVLVLGAGSKSSAMKHVIFPSDLHNQSLKVFTKMLKTAKDLGAKVTLLHCIPRPIEAVFQSGVYLFSGGWVPANLYLEKGEEKQRKLAAKWLEVAKKHGVATDLVIDASSISIVESILRHAQTLDADLIAMPAQSGAVASTLIGSYTRQIVRNATCPVWVLKTEK
jgi:nucleotide-binding universal stress UspA family protein